MRQPWSDRWLLDAFRQIGHPCAEHVSPAPSAWESLEAAGVKPEEIVALVCNLSGARPADLADVGAGQRDLLSPALAKRYDVVAVRIHDGALEVATANPLSNNLERDLAFACARRIRVTVASPGAIRDAQERVYGGGAPKAARLAWVVPLSPIMPAAAPTRGAAVDMLDRLVTDAVDQRASDVHFEPSEGELVVRFRVDGVLHDVVRVPTDVSPLLMSRIKVMGGLDIADRRRPQDGRASMVFDGRQIDVRISTLPLGDRVEKAVIRILDSTSTSLELDALGYTPGERYRLDKVLGLSEGLVLVVGPTGSGKTTTLYSALRQIQSRETNITTVEDPVEYRLDGVNQVQVNAKSGLTFAAALRSILRQDPDVVLVGEIRDAETAGIAIKASMTGHLVLSTLHTNDAPSAVGRLADIGADLGALGGALKGVMAQRLVRRLCSECSQEVALADLPPDQQTLLSGRKTEKMRRPVGCAACRGTGYRGRMVIAEILLVNEMMQAAIARGGTRSEVLSLAREGGMQSLWESGMARVLAGLTSLHELLDNVSAPAVEGLLGQSDVDRLIAQLAAQKAVAKPAPAPARSEPPPAAAGRTTIVRTLAVAPRPAAGGKLRVLVVHEDRAERRILRAAFEDAGCSVLEACDGEAALAYACRLRPDAVVTDASVPKLDGIALIQELVSEQIVAKVFLYVDSDDEPLLDWARELGACDTLTGRDGLATLVKRVRSEFEAPVQERIA
jgi:type II secretory ATPase GspE/PulE/Tfp pilus assembly ATPase PilB-like protein